MLKTPEKANKKTNSGLGGGVPSKSFLNLNAGALYGLFGSQLSLADMNDGTNGSLSTRPSSTDIVNLAKESQSQMTHKRHLSEAAAAAEGKKHFPAVVSSGRVPLTPLTLGVRLVALFLFGVAYGQFSRHIHDNHQVTTYTLDIDKTGAFSLLWGSQGILLGFLLPFFDWLFPEQGRKFHQGKGGTDWTSIMRAGAAFAGIAYGVRKFTWESTLQAAFYWGMVNPCLWFILDCTRNGFILASLIAIVGTTVFAMIFPEHLPVASFTETYISVTVWVASVFFCCAICFGNIGRRLLSFDLAQIEN